MYNPVNNNFTYKKGSFYSFSGGFSKGLNISSYRNSPSERRIAQMWVDSDDTIWLFSGDDYDVMTGDEGLTNDMWKYEIETGNWTKLKEPTENTCTR